MDTLKVNDDRKANSLETIEHYSISGFYEADSNSHSYSSDLYNGMIRDILPVTPNETKAPLEVRYPYDIHCSICVSHPMHWRVRGDKQSIIRDAYRFSFEDQAAGDTLLLKYSFKFLKDNIAAADLPQYETDRKKIVNNYLGYSYSYTPGKYSSGNKLNYWAITLYVFMIAACACAGVRIYKIQTENRIFVFREPRQLGGWILLPLLGLVVTIIRIPYHHFTKGFFKNAIWQTYDGTGKALVFKIMLSFEFITNTFLVCYATFCLALMLRRRDILPAYIKWFLGINVLFLLTDTVCYHLLMTPDGGSYNELLRGILGASIWIPYFHTSERVRTTFIIPYPERVTDMEKSSEMP